MAAMDQKTSDWVKGFAISGVVGGATLVVSDFFIDRQFAPPAGDTSEAATQSAELKRAVAQVILGLLLARMLWKWRKDVAVGVGFGGVIAGVRRISDAYNWGDKLSQWFPASSSAGAPRMGQRNVAALGAGRDRVTYEPSMGRSRVKVA